MPRLDLAQLDHAVQELFIAGLAGSTQKAYRSGEKRFVDFCAAAALRPFPATERILLSFVAFLFKEGLSAGTVKLYLAAVRHAQITLGLGDPRIANMPKLEYVMKGLRRATSTRGKRTRLPITPTVLRKLKASWERLPCREDAVMLWAVACFCFFGFLRLGEVVVPSDSLYDPEIHLSFEDVRVNSRSHPQWLEIRIKASKTDPFRQGVTVYVGATGRWLCPVAAGLAYMVQRSDRPGPLFLFKNGHALTRARFVTALRSALREAGVDVDSYSGHSFRIGAATTAAQYGLQDSLIQTLGRWRSSAYTLYIRTPPSTLTAVSRMLSLCD